LCHHKYKTTFMHLDTTPDHLEYCDPAEEAALRRVVATTTLTCVATTIQTAVTTANVALGQDWSQEGRKLLREFGLPTCASAPMRRA
jgi:hypothetical protein